MEEVFGNFVMVFITIYISGKIGLPFIGKLEYEMLFCTAITHISYLTLDLDF